MDNEGKRSSISFEGALTLVFIALKLAGFIDWNWFFVLLPIICVALLTIIYALLNYNETK